MDGSSKSLSPLPESADLIAVVGLAGRFPGARNVAELWENLKAGKECLTQPTDEQLRQAGIDAAVLAAPNYVRSFGKLDDIDLFDADFFGYSGRQASRLDPQHRVFLECIHEAMESTGWNPRIESRIAGVFAGSGSNLYAAQPEDLGSEDFTEAFEAAIAAGKDFLATRASYKLNFTGPSVVVQTACSTSLVAVHYACQSLLNFECDMAFAGGVSIQVPHGLGYLYHEGGIHSPDGHCRTFDARAQGAVGGSGVGVVALMRYDDAVAGRHTVLAIIKGSAVNNDGAQRVSYTAPGIQGQVKVIDAALAAAGVDAESIGLIEAHGTATRLGDSIELAALQEVFGLDPERIAYCALGSVKTNFGHLDAAAGVAGLIKAVLCLQHRSLVPSLHFQEPNPVLGTAGNPFFVNTRQRDWEVASGPRRAGVSSFGIGGTNAHVVLEEAPRRQVFTQEQGAQLFPISARTEPALRAQCANLHRYLAAHTKLRLTDIACTLQLGRQAFDHRICVIARECGDLLATLADIAGNDGLASRVIVAGIIPTYEREPLFALAQSWCTEPEVDWVKFNRGRNGHRIALPTYPFERRRHWLEPSRPERVSQAESRSPQRNPPEKWFYLPSWKPTPGPVAATPADIQHFGAWLVFCDGIGLGKSICAKLAGSARRVIAVETCAGEFKQLGPDRFAMDPHNAEHYSELVESARLQSMPTIAIVHGWTLNAGAPLERGPFSLLHLLKRLTAGVQLTVLGDSHAGKAYATMSALCKVANQELPNWACQSIALPPINGFPRNQAQLSRYPEQIIAHACSRESRPVSLSYANHRLLMEGYEQTELRQDSASAPVLRKRGVYLIAGGLGEVGLAVAEWLARMTEARLVLIGRTPVDARVSERVRAMEQLGAMVGIESADVTDANQMRRCLQNAEKQLGPINGVFHLAAAIRHPSSRCPLTSLTTADFLTQMQPKVEGFRVLDELLGDRELDFRICFSSNAALLGGSGLAAYSAASAALDHAINAQHEMGKPRWISINWDGLAMQGTSDAANDPYSLALPDSLAALSAILANANAPQIVVSATNLQPRLAAWTTIRADQPAALEPADTAAATSLTELEQAIVDIWKRILDIDSIGLHDDFFDLGGDSLVALKVMVRLRELTNVELPVDALFRSPTVAGLIEELDDHLVRLQASKLRASAARESTAVSA